MKAGGHRPAREGPPDLQLVPWESSGCRISDILRKTPGQKVGPFAVYMDGEQVGPEVEIHEPFLTGDRRPPAHFATDKANRLADTHRGREVLVKDLGRESRTIYRALWEARLPAGDLTRDIPEAAPPAPVNTPKVDDVARDYGESSRPDCGPSMNADPVEPARLGTGKGAATCKSDWRKEFDDTIRWMQIILGLVSLSSFVNFLLAIVT